MRVVWTNVMFEPRSNKSRLLAHKDRKQTKLVLLGRVEAFAPRGGRGKQGRNSETFHLLFSQFLFATILIWMASCMIILVLSFLFMWLPLWVTKLGNSMRTFWKGLAGFRPLQGYMPHRTNYSCYALTPLIDEDTYLVDQFNSDL